MERGLEGPGRGLQRKKKKTATPFSVPAKSPSPQFCQSRDPQGDFVVEGDRTCVSLDRPEN